MLVIRPHVRRPRRHVTREVYREADRNEVLRLFNDFVKDARKEFRKYDRLGIKGRVNERDCESVCFIGESFSLTINFNERVMV